MPPIVKTSKNINNLNSIPSVFVGGILSIGHWYGLLTHWTKNSLEQQSVFKASQYPGII